jgi:hypothetical protein
MRSEARAAVSSYWFDSKDNIDRAGERAHSRYESMNGYVKVLIPLAALGLLAFKYPVLRFLQVPDPPPPAQASTVAVKVDAAVELVRAGSLPGFDRATVGKAFENKFQDAQWSSFQTPNGVTIVNFHGSIKAHVLDAAGLNASSANPIVVRSNCIGSLGLGAKMAENAKAARASEERSLSAVAEMDQRKQSAPGSPAERDVAAGDEARIQECIANRPTPVNFHFVQSADQKKFQLGYIDKEPFGEATPEAVLAFVYQ